MRQSRYASLWLVGLGAVGTLVAFFAPWTNSRTVDWITQYLIPNLPLPGIGSWLAEVVWEGLFPGRQLTQSGAQLGLWLLPLLGLLAFIVAGVGEASSWRKPAAVLVLALGVLCVGFTFYVDSMIRRADGSLVLKMVGWFLNWQPGWGYFVGLTGSILVAAGGAWACVRAFMGQGWSPPTRQPPVAGVDPR